MNYILARLKEPSTWAGLAGLLVGLHILAPDSPLLAQIGPFGISLAGVIAALIPDPAKPVNPPPPDQSKTQSHAAIGLLALLLLLPLGACGDGTKVDLSTPQAKADAVDLVYTPVRLLAVLCAAGTVAPCTDPNVAVNVKLALPIADAAVAEAKRQILASNGDQSVIAQYSSYATSAIGVLAQALQTYGVKAPAG